MSEQFAMDIGQQAMMMVLTLAGPVLVVVLIVGVLVSAFQAMTQINEMSLSFIPKLVAVGVLLAVIGPWMLQTAVNYTTTMLTQLPSVTR